MKSIITALIATAVLGAPVFTQVPPQPPQTPQTAQQPRTPQPAQAPQAERERQPAEERERSPAPPPPPAAPPPPSERRPVPTQNVKVDVTITEQTGTGAPTRKTVTVIAADGRSSGVRSNSNVPLSTGPYRDLTLNVDASVNVTADRRVLLDLRFLYTSVSVMTPLAGEGRSAPVTPAEKDAAAPKPGFSSIQDILILLLTPGTPVIAARSADAASDRTVTVEVRAEILK